MRFQFAFVAAVILAPSFVFAGDNLDESKAIEKIELLGGTVTRDDEVAGRPVVAISFSQSNPGDNKRFNEKYLHLMNLLRTLSILDLANSPKTDDGLKEIKGLNNQTTLNIWGTNITDASPRIQDPKMNPKAPNGARAGHIVSAALSGALAFFWTNAAGSRRRGLRLPAAATDAAFGTTPQPL